MEQRVLMKGNEALGYGAIKAGCRSFFGYPITPQTELAAFMARELPRVCGTYIQAESEISAINMVLGAAAAGKRAMTSSSSPGISLKTEGVSYIAASDLPALIVNVQRGGPGLGSIQPAQGDYWQATRAMGHGDFRVIVLAPYSVQEMMDFVSLAFELSEKYRIPSMILSDGMLGQMMEPVVVDDTNSGIKQIEKPWATVGHADKRSHNIINSLYLTPSKLEAVVRERYDRYKVVQSTEQRAEEYLIDDADTVIVAYGASARIAYTAVNMAREKSKSVGLIRPITLWPFPENIIKKTAKTAKKFLCVEMSMGQMIDDVKLAVNGAREVEFFGRVGGSIPTPNEILDKIQSME